MKSVYMLILFLVSTCHCVGQVIGKTQSGKLFPKKDDVPPVIQLTSPTISYSDTLHVNEKILSIKGVIIDDSRIKS
ncbi:MAG: hypothetical protein ACW99A_10385, partial [Candidatus Kariarchaeaceae archaeon]